MKRQEPRDNRIIPRYEVRMTLDSEVRYLCIPPSMVKSRQPYSIPSFLNVIGASSLYFSRRISLLLRKPGSSDCCAKYSLLPDRCGLPNRAGSDQGLKCHAARTPSLRTTTTPSSGHQAPGTSGLEHDETIHTSGRTREIHVYNNACPSHVPAEVFHGQYG
jgi:hypothetical protein